MVLTSGTRLGAYEVTAQIGAGGMGEVYRARDGKLNRDVALKVLSEPFLLDVDRLARFRREAQVLASLNHPHIAQVYGFEDGGALHALVMELVEGPTLADRLTAGPIPSTEALSIARQIAAALEAAHSQGIVHRDLKPANIKVKEDGTVKVLDFGLAKALDPRPTSVVNASASPTFSLHATQAGLILGTAAYMSPEQARGKAVDTRADVWAFGAVLFEMLSGRRPFEGEDVSDAIANVLKSEPAWQLLPGDTPISIRRLMRRCLEKDPQQRLQHIGDARLEIDDAQRVSLPETTTRSPVSRREQLAWVSAVLLAILAAAAAWRTGDPPEAPEMRVEITTPGALSAGAFALSPDGWRLAFSAVGQRGPQLWIRSMDDTVPRPLPGTEGAQYPFWSPDSQSIGFFTASKLKRLDLDGGQPEPLVDVLTPAGGSWGSDGTILYVPIDSGGVFRVSAKGGDSREVTPSRSPRLATRVPAFLPDGRHFLFQVARGGEPAGTYVGELGNDSIKRITANGPAVYDAGHLWYVRDGSLFAQPFNPTTHVLGDGVRRVADDVATGLFASAISTSSAGAIAYRTGAAVSRRQLVWFDRSSKDRGPAGEEGQLVSNPALSPDGRHVAVQRTLSDQNISLWLLDVQRNVFTRLTDAPGLQSMPVWSPDGDRILFNNVPGDGGPPWALLRLDGTAALERLHIDSGEGAQIACDWSRDDVVLYKQFDQAAGTTDLWAVRMAGERKPFPVVRTPYDERDGQFSPDGKWIAYESNESGRPEIFIQPFPGPGKKERISIDGGTQVRWRRDGKELFYIGPDQNLMAVVMDPAAGRIPKPLFKTNIAPFRSISRQQYVVAADGQRFLIVTQQQAPLAPVTLILNWKANRSAPLASPPR